MSAMMPDRRNLGRLAALPILLLLVAGCLPPRSAGERLYRRHCASCHGVDGGGGVRYLADEGANLLDDSWKYGGDPFEIEYSLLNEDVRKHKLMLGPELPQKQRPGKHRKGLELHLKEGRNGEGLF